MGLALARLLRREGWGVALAARSTDALERAAADLRGAIPGEAPIVVLPTDIGEREQVRRMIAEAHARLGRVDALVNNAGLATLVPIGKTEPETIERSFAVNALGPAWATHFAWPIFEAQRGGCIINTSTMGTADPFPGFFAYAASKASVNLMARSCAKEGAAIGVRAFAIAPAATETPMLRGLFDAKKVPPAACMTPEDVARVMRDCILGRRDQDNGKTIFLKREGEGVTERVV